MISNHPLARVVGADGGSCAWKLPTFVHSQANRKEDFMSHRDEHIIIFEHRDFRGRHRHVFGQEANLNNAEDSTLNDKMSSFVILSGTWEFFRHSNFVEKVGGNLGPGQYESVTNFGIPNDAVSSLRAL